MSTTTIAVGETFAEHYSIVEAIKRSHPSITDVFVATDNRTPARDEVMLEVLKATASPVEKGRFGTRARRLATATHTSLTTMLDVQPQYCVFEALFGELASEHAGIAIARSRQKLAWLSQIASALAVLHQTGIVHGRIELNAITVQHDGIVKLTTPVGGDVTGTPLADVRALGITACELVLGPGAVEAEEAIITSAITDAGIVSEAAKVIGRACAGAAMTAEDLAKKLAPYSEYAGPSTEPLLQAVPKNPRRTDPLI